MGFGFTDLQWGLNEDEGIRGLSVGFDWVLELGKFGESERTGFGKSGNVGF